MAFLPADFAEKNERSVSLYPAQVEAPAHTRKGGFPCEFRANIQG